jgi:hypothetical protein
MTPSGSRKRISGFAITFTLKSAHKRNGIRDNLAGVENKLRNGTSEVRIPARKTYFSLPQNVQNVSRANTAYYAVGMGVQPGRQSGQRGKN